MASSINVFFIILSFALIRRTHTCFAIAIAIQSNGTIPKFPAILIFGDSIVDTGNNKYIPTIFRCSQPPYGENFQGGGATGRCSDGKLAPDIVASMIGLKETVPPFLNPNISEKDVVTRVSFASVGSGYDEHTTSLSNAISMPRQVMYLREYIRRVEGILGKKSGAEIVNRALVIVSAGTNDIVLTFPTKAVEINIGRYQNFLINKLRKFVEELYDLGCRKMVMFGLPPVGCLPLQQTLNHQVLTRCLDQQNKDAQSHNKKLQNVLLQLEGNLPMSQLIYGDIFSPLLSMINNPKKYGFVESRRGCCGTGILEVGPLCREETPRCENPNQYLFFDSIHPTEAAYKIITQEVMKITLPELV